MVRQYPYELWTISTAEASFDQTTGEYHASEAVSVFLCQCRDEGATSRHQGTDSESYQATATVYTPKGTPAIGVGTMIEVRDGTTVRLSGRVTSCRIGQLNTVITV